MALKHRNRSFRKIPVKLAIGVTTHYKKRHPAPAHCGSCGKSLQGIPRARSVEMRTMPKTKKRPERPYGGVLCSSCMRTRFLVQTQS